MTYRPLFLLSFASALIFASPVLAAPVGSLIPHKAIYDIDLVATHSGSQILNISGQMQYEWKASCDAWITDHHFKLFYEYADTPGMRITSDFSTYETFDGSDFHFTSRRQRDGEMYQEIRGIAGPGLAKFSKPENLKFDLAKGTLFPMGHTIELLKRAKAGDKIYSAQVFDGSDEDGPIEINTFIGKKAKSSAVANAKIEADLLKGDAWNMRMAIFPEKDQEEESDYEMSMVFHENGIITDMVIDYDDFSVRQSLVALEKLTAENCDSAVPDEKRP